MWHLHGLTSSTWVAAEVYKATENTLTLTWVICKFFLDWLHKWSSAIACVKVYWWRSGAHPPKTVLGTVKRTVPRHGMERCQLLLAPRSLSLCAWGFSAECVAHTNASLTGIYRRYRSMADSHRGFFFSLWYISYVMSSTPCPLLCNSCLWALQQLPMWSKSNWFEENLHLACQVTASQPTVQR